MSCSSPFIYLATATTSYNYVVNVSGSTQVPGYTSPGFSACLLGWNPAHCGGCNGQLCDGCLCNGWQWCNCCSSTCDSWQWISGSNYWYDCWNSPGIPLWPSLTIGATASIPMIFSLSEGTIINIGGPISSEQPYEASEITIQGFTVNLNINGSNVPIQFPDNVTLAQQNGTFSVTVCLGSNSDSFTENIMNYTINYTLDIATNLLFCLTPVPPAGWLNLQIVCTLTANVSIDSNTNLSGNTTFAFILPIISVEEEG